MKGPTPRRLQRFVCRRLGLGRYLDRPGDGRPRGQIAARHLLWALIVCRILRQEAFHAIEALVRSAARPALGVSRCFGDDALAYFTERLDPAITRTALATVLRRAKRNKGFQDSRFIGLALDCTGSGRSQRLRCAWCHPAHAADGGISSYGHKLSAISVVGTGLTLPFDVEPYGPGDSEYAASLRLLGRAVQNLGPRFADYVVADGEYARAPFLHRANDLGLHVVVRLKGNLPELFASAQARFEGRPPSLLFEDQTDRVEVWDEDDFDPWETLQWKTVRVIRYRQHKPDGKVVEAYWLTDFPQAKVGSRALYRICKNRWEIENQVFNDGKNHYGMEHVAHHQQNSLLMGWLLTCLALTIERLYRQRYLHRGTHPVLTPIALVRHLWISLGSPQAIDTS